MLERTKNHAKHFTVTGYVVNERRTKLLVIHHRKLNRWMPPGGHLEPNELPHEGAIREVFEETGISARLAENSGPDFGLAGIVDVQIPRPLALQYQLIPAGSEGSEHIHLDLVYHLTADEETVAVPQLSEVNAVRWMTKDEILDSREVFDSVRGFAREYLDRI